MIKVVRVEKLGDVCAFKPNEIQVVGNVYDKIPAEEKENFEAVVQSFDGIPAYRSQPQKARIPERGESLRMENRDPALPGIRT